MNSAAAGYGGGSCWWRVQRAFAHALPYVLVAGIAVRVATWFGWFVGVNQIVTVILLLCWLLSGQHRFQEHLCVRCMDEVPADAPTRAERRRPLLWLSHLSMSPMGIAIMAVVVVGPALLGFIAGQVTRPLAIPGDLWLFAVIYVGWIHHRLRPWCPYCRPWDDEGDEEHSPDPNRFTTKTGR